MAKVFVNSPSLRARWLVVQSSGVDHWADGLLAAQYHQQITNHGGFAFLVELDGPVFLEFLERHFDHSDGAIDDASACGDDGFRLLPAQHGFGDFRGVGQVAQAGLNDDHAGVAQPLQAVTIRS